MKNRTIRGVAAFIVSLFMLSSYAFAVSGDQIEPRYVGLSSSQPTISISGSGTISCSDVVTIKSGYSAAVVWELLGGPEGNLTNKGTWKAEGSSALSLDKKRVAVRGYTYQLKATIKVYNASGRCVDDVSFYSKSAKY